VAQETRRRFTTLDALRGVAALVVVGSHMPDYTISRLLPGAHLAVDFFFVLSGFVISDAYLDELQRGLSPLRFMAVRLARFYPLYLVGTAIGAAVLAYEHWANPGFAPVSIMSLIASAAFLPTPPAWSAHPVLALPLDMPGWSLSWELFANAVLALLIWLKLWRGRLPLIVGLSGAGLFALALARHNLDVGAMAEDFWFGAVRVVYPFFAGMLLHQMWRGRRWGWRLPAPVGAMGLLAILAIAPPAGLRGAYEALASLVLLPLIVLISTGERPERVLQPIGRASYGIYVLHFPLLALTIPLVRRLTGVDLLSAGVLGSLAFMAAVVVLALALDRVFDRPARALLLRAVQRLAGSVHDPVRAVAVDPPLESASSSGSSGAGR
jgi:peptidoglycan/LPS O-acetylase OafA/YrhL